MAAMGVLSLMRCCVCVSAKWTFSLVSVKSAGVVSCSPLIMPGNSHWPCVEREPTLRAFPRTHAVKAKFDWSGRGFNRIWCSGRAATRMSDLAEVSDLCSNRSRAQVWKGDQQLWQGCGQPTETNQPNKQTKNILHMLRYEWWVTTLSSTIIEVWGEEYWNSRWWMCCTHAQTHTRTVSRG